MAEKKEESVLNFDDLYDADAGVHPFKSGYLSQWHKVNFSDGATTYSSTEQYMMHQKALLMGDHTTAAKILQTDNPKQIKALGRKIKPWSQELWNEHKLKIVTQGNYLKFTQNPDLAKKLLSTKRKHICEASPWDNIWGVGMSPNHPQIQDPSQWQGTNLLGKALMMVRYQLTQTA